MADGLCVGEAVSVTLGLEDRLGVCVADADEVLEAVAS